jgi:NAD(P)-dependent dehydrogenase (short-subunit alcohol dehydrogenase family)
MRLQDKIAFITGAAGPMGEAVARRFAGEGARLALVDVSQRRLDAVQAGLPPGTDCLARRVDVLRNDEVQAAIAETVDRFGSIDIVVNIVGGIVSPRITTPMLEMDEAQFDATLALNLKSVFLTTRHAVPAMRKRSGRIVNLSSISLAGEPGQAEYSAAKAGVAALTRTMAIEFAPDVTVNCIAPALIRTRVLDRLDPGMVEGYRARTLLGRLGEPEDIAHAALFLASDEAAFITGAILPVSGGIWPAL